ncbi:MAG TPA: trigger factor [Solirubrobacterales bacterium]|nr:trigger factor [Solirubrobacterales bacterium]
MKTSVTELGDSRVRVDVGIDPDAVESRLDRAARSMAREMRVPGFRKGKVPPQLVIQRVGRDAVLEQALRDSLPEWYERALLEAGITPVGDPELSVPSIPGAGEELAFSIEVAVRPKAKLGDYVGLEVGRAEPEVPEEAVQAELDRLREGFASLTPVDRPARTGDLALIDYSGTADGEPFEGSEASDLMVEVGAESLLPEFDEALEGASAGDELTVEVSFPDDHRPEALAGKQGRFTVTVKEVREKELPELDDDFASEASEFETLDELREEIRTRLRAAFERRVEDDFREAAVDAAAASAQMEVPKELVHARAHEMWDRVERSLSSRGINPQTYAQMQGKTREELITDLEGDAERALRREATLAAVADAEGIEVSDEELLAALGPGEGDQAPERLLERLRKGGRDALLRSEVRLRKAADVIAGSAKPIALEQAEARERLWTPEKEQAPEGEGAGLWTPGDR